MDQAAEFLSISKSALYKYTSEKRLPYYHTGKRIYFKTAELAEWLTKHRITTRKEIDKEATDYIIRKGRIV